MNLIQAAKYWAYFSAMLLALLWFDYFFTIFGTIKAIIDLIIFGGLSICVLLSPFQFILGTHIIIKSIGRDKWLGVANITLSTSLFGLLKWAASTY